MVTAYSYSMFLAFSLPRFFELRSRARTYALDCKIRLHHWIGLEYRHRAMARIPSSPDPILSAVVEALLLVLVGALPPVLAVPEAGEGYLIPDAVKFDVMYETVVKRL